MIEKELSEQSKGNVTFDTFVPLSQVKKQLPDFPIKALPQQIRTYIEAVTESLQVPVDMVACDVLGVISLCVQGKFQIEVKEDWTEPLNLYLATIMRPSERKSPTLKYVTQPVFDYMKLENERRKPAIEQYEFEKKLLKDKLEKKQRDFVNGKKDVSKEDVIACQTELTELEETKPLQLILDDVTPEALTKAMKDNDERMGIISAEGGIFSIMSGRYTKSTANIDIFLKAYSCEYYSTCRIGRSENELNHALLDFVKNSNIYNVYFPILSFALSTGLRIGEIIGLRQEEVDMKEKVIHVRRQLIYKNYGDGFKFHVTKPKTQSGNRDIPLTETARKSLIKQKEIDFMTGRRSIEQEIEGLKGFVFINSKGMPVLPFNFNAMLRNVVSTYNKKEMAQAEREHREPVLLPHISAHILRHTFCTRAAETGIDPKTLQYLMGHGDISTTMNIYNHVDAERVQSEMKKLENII